MEHSRRISAGSLVLALLAAVSVAGFLLMAVPATRCGEIDISDTNMQKLEDQLAALDQSDKDMKAKIKEAENTISEQQQLKSYYDSQISITEQRIETTKALIAEYQNTIRLYSEQIAGLENNMAAQYQTVLDFLEISYEDSQLSYLDIVLNAGSIPEFLMSVERVGCLLEYQDSVIRDMNEQAELLTLLRGDNEMLMGKSEARSQELAQDEALLEDSKVKAQQLINTMLNNKTTAAATIQTNDELREQINKEIEEILIERQRQTNANYAGGDLMWPVDLKWSTVSSGFGWRTYDYQNHLGIDIPADYGEDVYAANSGVVVTATSHYSYGNYVLIDHGGGIATLYAHNSKLLVSEGDKVYKGQVIAKVGSTGQSSGNHCHFEIRVNGKVKNPLDGESPCVVQP